LAFVPAAPFLIGCADFGLISCLDLAGRWLWQDGLVAHVGSLAINGDGERIVLACFSEGLRRYSVKARQQGRLPVQDACRLAAIAFDGSRLLVADLANQLLLLDYEGRLRARYRLNKPLVALALAALADSTMVALADGTVLAMEIRDGAGG
jgi:hypothetical protein